MNGGKFEVGQDEVTVTAPERTMDCIERPRCDTNEGVAIEVTVTSEHMHKQEEHRSRKEQRGFWDRGRRERKKEGDVHLSILNLGLYLREKVGFIENTAIRHRRGG